MADHFNSKTRNMDGALDALNKSNKQRDLAQTALDKIAALALEREVLFSSEILEIIASPEGIFVEG